MSHITTTSHAGRAGFGALAQPHVQNESLVDHEETYVHEGYTNQAYERRYDGENDIYNERRYDSIVEPVDEYENSPKHGGDRPWSNSETDYTRVSTIYKPDMITYNETILNAPPEPDQKRPNYKPSALRWPYLTILLVTIFAFIGLMAWALHDLPVVNSNLEILPDGLRARDVHILVSYTAASIDSRDVGSAFTTAPLAERAETTSEAEPGGTMTPPPGDFGHVGIQTVTEPADATTTPPPLVDPVTSPDSGSTSSSEPAYSKPEEDFGNIGGPVTISEIGTPPPSAPWKGSTDYGDVGTNTVTVQAPPSDYGHAGIVTISETTAIQTPTFVTPTVTVLTDSQGIATATSTDIPTPISTPQTTTLTDAQGRPTATQETHVLITPSVIIQTDSNGNPTATATLYPVMPSSDSDSIANVVVKTYSISYGQYFIGMFLPTLAAIILAVPIRILDVNAKILQPWHELARPSASPHGAPGRDSLCLDTSGWQSVIAGMRALFIGGQPLAFLTSALVLGSALLIPLAAEAVSFDLHGSGCVKGGESARNCAYVLSVFDQAAKAAIALLAVMGIATIVVIWVLARWHSGVKTNPWSICGTASLALNPDVRRLFTSLPAGVDAGRMPKGLLESVLEDRPFKLGYFYGTNGTVEYGIMLSDQHGAGYIPGKVDNGEKEPRDHHVAPTKAKHHLPFLMLGYVGRSIFLFVLCGLLALILYYNNTGGDTPFERFMDSESFGVRFLFTGVGVVISFFWASFFSSIAILSPYQLLASSPQHARRSILLAPPTNAFSGLWSSIRRRHAFLAIVALTSILSEFLTIFLCNIPYRVTQTFLVHTICTWAAVGILGIMVLVVVGSFFVPWPHMPVDPSTVAGALYYVCDSWMLSRFEGLSTMKRKDRDWRINEMGLKYEFGEIRGSSGTVRIGVDASSSSGSSWAL